MQEHGRTLVELIIALAIVVILASVSIPHLRAYAVEAHLLGAARMFKAEFRKARSIAAARNVYTAIRFERNGDRDYFSVYVDGNLNGVRSDDIQSGRDVRIAGPFPVDGRAPGVRVGINPGVPALPPEAGLLDTRDPIRFGRSNMVSFSPLGTATPGTFFLAGEAVQGAVRVTGGSARVRLMVWRGTWQERP
jgi:Tfp pilus assembly major pilin PilA